MVSNDINDLGKKFKKNAASLNKTKGRRHLLDTIDTGLYILARNSHRKWFTPFPILKYITYYNM